MYSITANSLVFSPSGLTYDTQIRFQFTPVQFHNYIGLFYKIARMRYGCPSPCLKSFFSYLPCLPIVARRDLLPSALYGYFY